MGEALPLRLPAECALWPRLMLRSETANDAKGGVTEEPTGRADAAEPEYRIAADFAFGAGDILLAESESPLRAV
jgi:hypothetical protein